MELTNIYIILLFISLVFLIAQVSVREKQTVHIIFALFCGSIAIMATKKISGDTIGAYQYLIGMAACATCNGYWLLSRSLFREKNAILTPHIIISVAIALLIMANQGYLFINSSEIITYKINSVIPYVLNELTVLFSSTVIMLSFWEGCRGYNAESQKGKSQRLLFLATSGLAVTLSKLSNGLFSDIPEYKELFTTLIILFVLTNTQILIIWRFHKTKSSTSSKEALDNLSPAKIKQCDVQANATCNIEQTLAATCNIEQTLANSVESLLVEQSLYLKTNLKVADIARELNVPEYKISKALRNNLSAKNFNQYINELRIKHAKRLLADPDKQKWSVLVVSLESGFASVGPFTRTFKLITGYTPNQYRQNELT
jgi:AraC-like DNA-binding protein